MQENPKFVPMARPYASHIPNIFIYVLIFVHPFTVHSRKARRHPPFKINLRNMHVSQINFDGGCSLSASMGQRQNTNADEPEVRRVGFASFALLPPSRARAPLPLWWEEELWFGRGALRNAREAEIRTYGSSVCFSYTKYYYIRTHLRLSVYGSFTENTPSVRWATGRIRTQTSQRYEE